jgi:hypothetical protein
MAETEGLAMTKRDAGRGTGDGVKWKGEAPAEPKRLRLANSDWRLVKRQQFHLNGTYRRALPIFQANMKLLGGMI